PDNPWSRYYMGTVFVYLGDYSAAIEQYQLGIEANGNLPDLYYGLGYNYYALSSVPDAILAFERAVEVDPENAAAYDALAHMYLQLGENPLAEENALKSVELNPN
ncbi:MAG: tetratricopeptide repeat protein, partial [Anaerolineales bacterium]|nr:tetratricopeptide repeat protein [Anaerolineales bacterium]